MNNVWLRLLRVPGVSNEIITVIRCVVEMEHILECMFLKKNGNDSGMRRGRVGIRRQTETRIEHARTNIHRFDE